MVSGSMVRHFLQKTYHQRVDQVLKFFPGALETRLSSRSPPISAGWSKIAAPQKPSASRSRSISPFPRLYLKRLSGSAPSAEIATEGAPTPFSLAVLATVKWQVMLDAAIFIIVGCFCLRGSRTDK